MGKIKLREYKEAPTFRKIAMGTWTNAKDPSVYGLLEIDMKKTLELLPEYEKKHQIKVSPSHLVGKALSLCMKNRPEINGLIRGSKLYLRDHVSLFYQVSIPGKKGHEIDQANLSGTTIDKAEQKEVFQIARELNDKASLVREGKDKEYSKNLNAFKYIPWWFSKYYLNIASWLVYGLNLDLSFLGIPKDPFGSAMITNVGSMGIDIGFAPLCPYTRVPLILLLGSIQEKAVVVDGQVVAREVLPIGVTFDHRFIDGVHASQMAKELKKCFEEPEKFLLK